MPFKKVNAIVEATILVPPEEGDHLEPPIYLPVEPPDPPLTIWGDILVPTHPIYIPAPPPTDAHPEHPIVLPPDTGGGPPDVGDAHPDHTLPGDLPVPTHPIYLPVPPPPDSGLHPAHPIYWPVEIWGPTDPRPTPPIELPPWTGPGDGPPDIDDDAKQKLIDFLFGHLPPSETPPPQAVPN